MNLDPGEVQILKGPGLTVTDKRIIAVKDSPVITRQEQIAVADVKDPRVVAASIETSVVPAFLTIGALLLAAGAVGPWYIAIVGFGIMVSGFFIKVKRTGFVVSVDAKDGRKTIYTTAKEAEARLAVAAVSEALRRAA